MIFQSTKAIVRLMHPVLKATYYDIPHIDPSKHLTVSKHVTPLYDDQIGIVPFVKKFNTP